MFTFKRRLVLSALMLIALMLSFVPVAWAEGPITVSILHTDDTHAHLEPF